ncbi:MAG: Gfo/Idh/MocA family protein [Planctomycetota bacterium]
MSRIKYGQIGTSHAHANKMGVYRKSDDYEVVGVVEPDDAQWQRVKDRSEYRDLKRMTRDELLNVSGLQVVGVETQVRDLLDNAEICIEAGKHIHLDKPAGESLPQFRRILDQAAKKHLAVQMGYMYRFNPAVLLMRDFLKKGWLGEPFEVHTVMSKVVPDATRRSLAEYHGGMLFELGCHILDLAIGVLGKPTAVHGFAQHAGRQDDDLQDNMLATLEFPRAIATVKSSALEVAGFARRHFVVCGTEGTLHIEPLDCPNIRVAFSKPRGKYQGGYQTIEIGNYPRYVGDAADLAKIVRGEKDNEYSYEHDLIVQQTLLTACGLPTDE